MKSVYLPQPMLDPAGEELLAKEARMLRGSELSEDERAAALAEAHALCGAMGIDAAVNTVARCVAPLALGALLRAKGEAAAFGGASGLVLGAVGLALGLLVMFGTHAPAVCPKDADGTPLSDEAVLAAADFGLFVDLSSMCQKENDQGKNLLYLGSDLTFLISSGFFPFSDRRRGGWTSPCE